MAKIPPPPASMTMTKAHALRVQAERGAAAFALYAESLKVPANTLAVGEKIRCEIMAPNGASASYFATIVAIEPRRLTGASLKDGVMVPYDLEGMTIRTESPKFGTSSLTCEPSHMVRKAWSTEDKTARLAPALAFQATLTKAGTVRKRLEAAA
jgi:hypothetical protein